jgi:hypothetical protein
MTVVEDTRQEFPIVAPELPSQIESPEKTLISSLATNVSIEVEVVGTSASVNHVDDEAEAEDDDSECLISYSEAEVTEDISIPEETQDLQILLGHSINDAIEMLAQQDADKSEMSAHQVDFVTPTTTVGIDELGQFTPPEIHIFEDKVVSDDVPYSRQSLDHSVMFSFSAEQIVIPSPPKRQISAKYDDNVSPFCFVQSVTK